jgi:hypothetical protein
LRGFLVRVEFQALPAPCRSGGLEVPSSNLGAPIGKPP